MRIWRSIPLMTLMVVTGCSVHPEYKRPSINLPASWLGAIGLPQSDPIPPMGEWWRTFDDRSLEALLEAVFANNRDLGAASRRIAQARAEARVAASSRYPAITGELGAERARPFSGGTVQNKFHAEVNVGFEPDLWDKFGNLARGSGAIVDAAIESERAVKLTLAADASNSYFELGALMQRLEVARRSLEVAQRIDGIVETRHRNGAVSGLDRAQSRASLATIRATIPTLEQGITQARYTLALLAGRQPTTLEVSPQRLTEVRLPQRLPVGLPSQILLRRPDIRLAEANLRAAHADVGVARAGLYPSLLLTTDAGYASTQLSHLLRGSSGLLSIGANLLAPIFQAGKLQAQVDRASERHAELVHAYHQTVLGSLREVESALIALEKLEVQESMQTDAIEHAAKAFELAEVRYKAGLVDALTLLTTQTAVLTAENALLQTRFARISTVVNLHRALGGDW